MHIPKYLVLTFVTVLCASSLHAQRADSDIQAKAREQLRLAMEQLDAGKPAVATNAVAVKPKKEKPLAKPAVVTAPPAVTVTPASAGSAAVVVPSSKELSAAEEAKARESMRKAEQEMMAQKKAAATTAAKAQASQPKVAPAVETTAAPMMAAPTPAPKVKVVEGSAIAASPSAVPMVSSPAGGSKDQRLLDLLQAYKADKITPTEYHAQRAKILAEP